MSTAWRAQVVMGACRPRRLCTKTEKNMAVLAPSRPPVYPVARRRRLVHSVQLGHRAEGRACVSKDSSLEGREARAKGAPQDDSLGAWAHTPARRQRVSTKGERLERKKCLERRDVSVLSSFHTKVARVGRERDEIQNASCFQERRARRAMYTYVGARVLPRERCRLPRLGPRALEVLGRRRPAPNHSISIENSTFGV